MISNLEKFIKVKLEITKCMPSSPEVTTAVGYEDPLATKKRAEMSVGVQPLSGAESSVRS